jgi:uncharacterized protein YdcH (DUF465 family)
MDTENKKNACVEPDYKYYYYEYQKEIAELKKQNLELKSIIKSISSIL